MTHAVGFSLNPVWLKVSPELSAMEKLVYAELLKHVGKHAVCNPKIRTLAMELNVHERTVQRAVRALVRLKLVAVHDVGGRGHTSMYSLPAHQWHDRDEKWSRLLATERHEESKKRASERAIARMVEAPHPWRGEDVKGDTEDPERVTSMGDTEGVERVTTPPPFEVLKGDNPVAIKGDNPVVSQRVTGLSSYEYIQTEENILKEKRTTAPLLQAGTPTEREASEAARRQQLDRPTDRSADRPTDRPSPGSGGPPPKAPSASLRVVPTKGGGEAAKLKAALRLRRAKALSEAERVWREEMLKHYPAAPLDALPWNPQSGEGKNIASLLEGYELDSVLKYLKFAIASWAVLVKRYEKSTSFPGTPTTIWVNWKCKELIAEAHGAGAVTPAQQVRSLKDRLAAWSKEHPGELPPDDLAMEAWRAPKLKGDKV